MKRRIAYLVIVALTALGLSLFEGPSVAQTAPKPADSDVVTPPPVPPAETPSEADVVAPPLDRRQVGEAALGRLIAARNRELARQAEALEALARGLRLYLRTGPVLAAGPLTKAASHSDVHALTTSLSRPLGKLAAECRAAAAAAPAPDRRGGPCYRCGDTGESSCLKCAASGRVICPTCSGLGAVREEDPAGRTVVTGLCEKCGSSGVIECDRCGGKGRVHCKICEDRPGRPAPPSAAEQREMKKVICKARWLRAGGIDLYTTGARQVSPK